MKKLLVLIAALFCWTGAFATASKSRASITVASVSSLAGVKATNSITVASNTTLKNKYITVNGKRLRYGYEWKLGATAAATATNIAASLNNIFGIDASAASNVVYATATAVGTAGNAYSMSSSGSGLTVGSALFTGGVNAGYIEINGIRLTVGVDCALGGTTSAMATNLSGAILANPGLAKIIVSTHAAAVVYATSTQVGNNAYSLVGYPANKLVVSSNVFTSGGSPAGEITRFKTVIADKYYGDGSGLMNVAGATADYSTTAGTAAHVPASGITAGTLATTVLISTVPALNGHLLTNLTSANLTGSNTIPIGTLPVSILDRQLTATLGDGSTVISTGTRHIPLRVPYDMTITSWQIDQAVPTTSTGSVKVAIVKYSSYPASSSYIVGSATPTVTSAYAATGSTLTGWTVTLSKGDLLDFVVQTVAVAKRIVVNLIGVAR
jgi:hypothetical protein